MLTKKENEILDLTKEVFNKAVELPVEHPHDMQIIHTHVLAIQNLLFARAGYREYLATAADDTNGIHQVELLDQKIILQTKTSFSKR